MNYKELLDRYKKGLVSEEEKLLVEQELEKQLAIEEYVSEALDEEFNDIAKTLDLGTHDEETIKLKKSVNHRLRKVVLKSVFIVVALYIGVFHLGSSIIDGLYYDPTSITKSKDEESQFPDFHYDMQAYISLNMPGYAINSITLRDSKKFGNYEVSYSMKELFTKNEERHFVNLSRGKLTHGFDGIFSGKNQREIWEGFERIKYGVPKDISEDERKLYYKGIHGNNEETIRYLNELNPLSYISMSIVFNEDLTMEEFYHMTSEHPSINFKWAGIRTLEPGTKGSESQSMYLVGFNPNIRDELSFGQSPDPDKYPIFNLEDMRGHPMVWKGDYPESISEAYRIHFRSRLEYLRDREDFVKIFDYNHLKTDFYDDALAYIDKHGVKTYGVLVFGTAAELLEEIDEIPYDSIYINNVLPTKPNIYYD